MTKPLDIERFIAGLHDYLDKAFAPFNQRLAALEQQDTLSLADSYRGTWQPNNKYARGSLTTHAGSLWLAMEDVEGKPGNSAGWRLIVKAGRDGSS